MTAIDQLTEFALAPLTPTDRASAIAALSALDWAACGIAGQAEGGFTSWADAQTGQGACGTFIGQLRDPATAALVNGTLSHALDFDDTHFGHIGHPSVVIFPAVLAAGPADWTAMIDAALVGIEGSIRVGQWLGRGHYQAGFHQTATAGAFGAALAAGRVLGLRDTQMHHALGLVSTMASGLKAQFGTMGKPLNAGLAARAGVEAALWAGQGMTGAADGLGAFAAAHGIEGDGGAWQDLGTEWRLETLSYKFHACCHGLHATLEALRGATLDAPDRIEVRTHPRWLTVCNIAAPRTGLQCKFSYAQIVAMALSGVDTGRIEKFTDAAAHDPVLIAMRERVVVLGDDTLTEEQAQVTLTRGAETEALRHDLSARIDVSELDTRLRHKAEHLIGQDTAAALWTARNNCDPSAFQTAAFT